MPFKSFGFLGKEIENGRQMVKNKFAQYFNLASDVNAFSLTTISRLKFNKDNLQDCLMGAIFAKIIHSFQSVVILAQYGLESDSRIILRALLDSAFVFGAICKDEGFAEKYIGSQKAERLRSINSALNSHRNLFDDDTIKELEKQRDILTAEKKKKEFQAIIPEQIANDAGLGSVYLLNYRPLCVDVHTGSEALECFLNLDKDNEIRSIKLGPRTESIPDNLCNAVAIMLYAIGFLCVVKGIDEETALMAYKEKLKLIRENCP